jgi:hypothetical protein
MADRRTGIDGDQMTDRTISETEIDISNYSSLADKLVLGWDATNQKFKWYNADELANYFNNYQTIEAQSSTTSSTFQDKLSYTTPTLVAGIYQFDWQAEIQRSGGTIVEVRLTVDGTEYCLDSQEADANDWILSRGFVRLTFVTSTTHTIKIQWRSNTNGRSSLIRRARLISCLVGS